MRNLWSPRKFCKNAFEMVLHRAATTAYLFLAMSWPRSHIDRANAGFQAGFGAREMVDD